jgi:hypothetical protein
MLSYYSYAPFKNTKLPDEIKHPGVAYLLLSIAFTYQRAHKPGDSEGDQFSVNHDKIQNIHYQ